MPPTFIYFETSLKKSNPFELRIFFTFQETEKLDFSLLVTPISPLAG